MVETDTAENGDSKQRTRRMLAALTIGLVVVGALVAYGFSRSSGDRPSVSTTTSNPTPTIGIIQAPALVDSTRPVVQGSSPGTVDVPVAPLGTADIVVPPGTADIAIPPGVTVIATP
jgi:hypothetical protein